MDYGEIFKRALGVIRRAPFLLGVGFLAAASLESFALIGRLAFGDGRTPVALEPGRLLQAVQLRLNDTRWLTTAVVGLFFLLLAVWLLVTIAEGGLIVAVGRLERGKTAGIRAAVRAGVGLLGRFIAIDTLLFFPLFLVSLLILVVGTGALAGAALNLANQGDQTGPLLILGLGMACLLGLSCLLVPLAIATFLYRALAFREAALTGSGTRASLRRAWGRLRANFAAVLIVGLVAFAIRAAGRLIRAGVTLPFAFLAALAIPVADVAAEAGLLLTALALTTLVHTFISAVWTLTYGSIISDEQT